MRSNFTTKSVSLFAAAMTLTVASPSLLQAGARKSNVECDTQAVNSSRNSMRILIAKDLEGAQLEVKGGYTLYDPMSGKKLDGSLTGASFYVFPTTEGLKWGEEFPGIYQLKVVPDRGAILLSGIEYQGAMYVYHIDGALAFVNEMSLDDYADSLLSTKVPRYVQDKEVLSALAIAARTDALNKAVNAKSLYFDVKAPDIEYQGHGVSRKDPGFRESLKSTRMMVLSKGARHEKIIPFAIGWFEAGECTAPLGEMQKKAQEGLDGREILLALFPDATIRLAN